jgi:lipoprotein NlpI
VRVLTRPDTTARSAADFYKRGHDYRKLGMWALAVAQWRRAVGLAPEEGLYYKDLGIGYAKIKRFDRSLRVLKEAQQKRNADHSLAEIIALVEEQASKEARAHAG